MRKRFLPFLLLISLSALGQRNLSGSIQHSAYTYVYRINLKEAERLCNKGLHTVSENYLYALVDSFRKEEPRLQAGNYLYVRAAEDELV